MAKTVICINTLTTLDQMAYANHIQFFFRLGRNNPEDTFALWTPRRMSIDRCRNEAVKVAMENDFDYVMFIDDDVIIPFTAYAQLKAADKDIIAGWTIIRGYPYQNMAFKYIDDDNLVLYDDMPTEGIVDVGATGCSCCLVKVSLLKKIPPAYFVTGVYNTEDVYFCVKARKYVPDCTICIDTSLQTGHLLGSTPVFPWNKEDFKAMDEKENPLLVSPKEDCFRGEEYLKSLNLDA